MSAAPKEVLYIDVEDEITTIIDKMHSSPSKIIALVLPKRASVFQSIVNMRLLKRTADEAKKHIVLVTSEINILPLAGAVGIHVAKTAQSKPVIPPAPKTSDAPITVNEIEVEDADGEPQYSGGLDPQASIGELAGLPISDQEETIEVDNDEVDPLIAAAAATEKIDKKSFNKKLKIPDFDKFRVRLFLGAGLLLLLIVGWYVAFYVMPKARIVIKTDAVSVNSNLNLIASPAATKVDTAKLTVPGLVKEYTKSDSQKIQPTGTKDVGTKASGTMTVYNCTDEAVTVPAGSSFANSNFNFLTDEAATVPASDFFSSGSCKFNKSSEVNVTAAQSGDAYNLSAGRSYTSSIGPTLTGKGSSMSGGTSKIVKVVSQQDIDNVKQKILNASSKPATEEISKQLKAEGYTPLVDTIRASEPITTSNPSLNQEATEATVSVVTKYSMVGAKQDSVKELVEADIKKQIDSTKQTILNNGIDNAVIRVTDKKDNGTTTFNIQSAASAGVQQDSAEAIKKAVAGKKKGEVKSIIRARPGIKDVSVEYSPFWVYNTPGNTSKITIVFESDNGNTNN